jgi:Tol biopolymer transport system component/tRNA A-37 threonylcarbamoyl transferase component Bud32
MLGPYPVEHELGRGGMGVVYLGRDPKLNRQVAIKVLADHLANDPEHLGRFRREATLLASVNHPNIAAVYGVEDVASGDGRRQLLVLEYVPGETLAAHIARGPLSLDDTLDVCRQIAAGLEAAHERGVIHRDLKPGNVKVTPEGQVKVLDFGLARGDVVSGASIDGMSPTLTYSPTGLGVILGTAGYMSPEQARGKPVDRRTDVWALGCVLYECLTGKRAFDGETVSDTIANILAREPDWPALPPGTPAPLVGLMERCLERDPRKRRRDIGDVGVQLAEIAAYRSAPDAARPRGPAARSRPQILALGLALLAGAAIGIGAWAALARPAGGGDQRVVRLSLALPEGLTLPLGGEASPLSVTPDGRHVLFRARPRAAPGADLVEADYRIYKRALDAFETTALPGTEFAAAFTISPDSRWVAAVTNVSEQATDMQIVKVPLDGSSPPVRLASWDRGWDDSVVWLADGDLLALHETAGTLHRLPSGGGAWREAGRIDTGGATGYPQLARTIVDADGVMLSLITWSSGDFQQGEWLLDPASGRATKLLDSGGRAVVAPTGDLVFSRGDTLLASAFDRAGPRLTGDVRALATGLRTAAGWSPGEFSLSSTGTLVYVPGELAGRDRRLVLVDEGGSVEPYVDEPRAFDETPAISADGRRAAAVISNRAGTYEIWTADRDRPGVTPAASFGGADAVEPALSATGEWLAFIRNARDADDGVYLHRVGTSEPPRRILALTDPQQYPFPTGFLPDGSGVIVTMATGQGFTADIVLVPLGPDGTAGDAQPIRASPSSEWSGVISRDGRLFAFISDESGRPEVYVATWNGGGGLGPVLKVSTGLAERAAWGSGDRLFFSESPARLMSVRVSIDPQLTASQPVFVRDLDALDVVNDDYWQIMPDDRLFVMQRGESERDVTELRVVVNWIEELRASGGR